MSSPTSKPESDYVAGPDAREISQIAGMLGVTIDGLAEMAEISSEVLYEALSSGEAHSGLMNRIRNIRTIWLMKRQIALYESQRKPVESEPDPTESPIDLAQIYQVHSEGDHSHVHVEHQIYGHIRQFIEGC